MRERGVWLGILVGGVGLLLTALVLFRGGGFFVVVPHLAWVVPLAVVGTAGALAAAGVGGRRVGPVHWLWLVVIAAAAWNILVYRIKFGDMLKLLVPVAHPAGADFRDGLFDPAKAFTTAGSGWPPFTLWIGKAFTGLSLHSGYVVQVGILVAMAVGSAALCGWLAVRAVEGRAGLMGGPDTDGIDAVQLGILGGLWLFTCYGFLYEVDRGQVNLYALFFSLLCVWLLLKRPAGSPWWPALALAVADNLKVYPAVLAVLILWRYRWRALVPLLVTNVALLFAAGPVNVSRFFHTQFGYESTDRYLWWGNMSAVSLAQALRIAHQWAPSWLGPALMALTLIVWVATLVVLMSAGWSERRVVIAAAACVPVMCTVPNVSHDYKLVLLVFPLTVLGAVVATRRPSGGPLWALLFMAVAWEFMLLARSSMLIAPALQSSKFALTVGLQVLLLLAAVWERAPAGEVTGRPLEEAEVQTTAEVGG